MKKVSVSAPGKLMLFGEHAAIYGRPCIVTAVGQRMKTTVELTQNLIFQLEAPDVQITNYQKPMRNLGKGDMPKGVKFVERAVYNFYNNYLRYTKKGGLRINTSSEFSSQFGFGSSSAVTVCVIKALSKLSGKNLSKKEIFDLSYKTVLDVQGKGSGFDIAAATYGGVIYFLTAGKKITLLPVKHLPIIVGYTGIKFDTVRLINQVAKRRQKYPALIDNIYSSIGKLVEQAKIAILKEDLITLGELMNMNEGYLAALGVEGQKLADMIYAAREAGAWGAKLSGAGLGDCMIAIAPPSKIKSVKEAITESGGQIIEVETNPEGVGVEFS